MNLKPLADRLIIKAEEQPSITPGGLHIPDVAQERPVRGKVIAVGAGKVTNEGVTIPMNVQAGDMVLFGKYAGAEFKLDGESYHIMREADVFGVVE